MLTAATLTQQYESTWSSLSPRQRSAFRGNLTWLLGKTSDPSERQALEQLRLLTQAENPTPSSRAASAAPAPAPIRLFAARLELHRTPLTLREPPLGEPVHNDTQAARIASTLIGAQPQEHLLLLLLNAQQAIVGVQTVHIGTTCQCVVHAGDILRIALLANAPSVILAHNHPSGETIPSDADIKTTREIVVAGQLLGVDVQDHLIVSDDPARFTSLRKRQPTLFNRTYQLL